MNMHRTVKRNLARWLIPACFLLAFLGGFDRSSLAVEEPPGNRWEGDIRAFEDRDKKSPPPEGALLFVGSSSIRMWDLPKYFPDLSTINRGFGGSQIADSIEFASRIILPYKPRIIVFYAGDNDIAAGKSPETVLRDFKTFVRKLRDPLLGTPIIYIAIKPSIQRWNLAEKMRDANALIREFTETDPLLRFCDVFGPMLGEDGKPHADLFMQDGLHLNDAGYRLWTSLLLPHLRAILSEQDEAVEHKLPILVNHVGFVPDAEKCCIMPGTGAAPFEVVDEVSGVVVFQGTMVPRKGDFDTFLVGDFTAVRKPGCYIIRTANARSRPFQISANVYDDVLRKMVRYFRVQRCGPSETGYNAPCHLDDGRRVDNKEHQDVSGGWHDACDLRKWVGATIYGMIGLARLHEVRRPDWDRGQILEELRWGNAYFLKMQEPEGVVLHNCGGDVFEHGDNNRWTDNRVGTDDDRLIQTTPAPTVAQFNFITAQALLARLTRKGDPVYSRQCLDAALRCLAWCQKNEKGNGAGELGAAIQACLSLYETLREEKYRDLAVEFADRLLALQVKDVIAEDPAVRGFFLISQNNPRPDRQISRGCLHLIGLCDLYRSFPDHKDAPRWRTAIEMYCRDYLETVSRRNNFQIVPYGFYAGDDPGGGRRVGDYYYRYFMKPDQRWWVGINANLASSGVGLIKAARVLRDGRLASLAQHQLDWIVGVNPFNASTIQGVGYNHPEQFVTGEFRPVTPPIPGAVMNGIGGDADDQPDLKSGSWQTCEYWTPMVAYTMWLMTEIQTQESP